MYSAFFIVAVPTNTEILIFYFHFANQQLYGIVADKEKGLKEGQTLLHVACIVAATKSTSWNEVTLSNNMKSKL